MINESMLQPMVILVAWSLLIWGGMYATRIPAIQAAKIQLDSNAPSGQQMSTLPVKVRWKADNYNHLMEWPTIFYAVAISLALLGPLDASTVYFAGAYVVLRIIHSLVQVTSNIIVRRFAVFALSNVMLFALTIDAIMLVFKVGA